METIRIGGQQVVGFALGDTVVVVRRPFTKFGGFMLGATLAGFASVTGAALLGEPFGADPDTRIKANAMPILWAAGGGGLAGMLVASRNSL
jgi:hypothetical protein